MLNTTYNLYQERRMKKRYKVTLFLLCLLPLLSFGQSRNFFTNAKWQKTIKTPQDHQRLRFFNSLYEQALQKPKAMGEIPKVLHVIWLGPDPFPPSSLSALQTWKTHHKDWKIKFWTDQERCVFLPDMQLCTRFPLGDLEEIYYNAEEYEERSLILRYAILLNEGGIFIDHETVCLCSLEDLRDAYDFFCGLEPPGPSIRSSCINPSAHLLASTRGHPIFIEAIHWLKTNWEEYAMLFPGSDAQSIANRMVHRSVNALWVGIETFAGLDGRKDVVFPPDFFNSSSPTSAKYTLSKPKTLFGQRIQQAQDKEKMQAALTTIDKQLRIYFALTCALAALNFLLGLVILYLYRKRKKK